MDITSYISDTKRLGHAYIISGAENDALELAASLSQAMVCSSDAKRPCLICDDCRKAQRGVHPDIIHTEKLPDKREILVDQARAIRTDAYTRPNEASKKVYIIHDADTMNAAAQNALLKVLEEPPAYAAFILCTQNPTALLETVRSRCTVINTVPSGDDTPSDEYIEYAERFFNASKKPVELARFTFGLDKLDRIEFKKFTDASKALSVQKLINCADKKEAQLILKRIEVCDKAAKMLDANVSVGHIAGMIFAELTN